MQPINMIMIYYYGKIACPDIIIIEKQSFNFSSSKDAFLLDVFQITAIALVSLK